MLKCNGLIVNSQFGIILAVLCASVVVQRSQRLWTVFRSSF